MIENLMNKIKNYSMKQVADLLILLNEWKNWMGKRSNRFFDSLSQTNESFGTNRFFESNGWFWTTDHLILYPKNVNENLWGNWNLGIVSALFCVLLFIVEIVDMILI